MATKSFTTEFKINKKTSEKVANALFNSKRINHEISQRVEIIKDKEKINKIMSNLFSEK